jgi:Amt family ammonium transporter
LVCGIWGTLAVGIFGAKAGTDQLMSQLCGVASIGVFTALFCLIIGLALKFTLGLRVDEEEEFRGLDLSEHGINAYSTN